MSLSAALQFIGILADYECPYQQRYNLLNILADSDCPYQPCATNLLKILVDNESPYNPRVSARNVCTGSTIRALLI